MIKGFFFKFYFVLVHMDGFLPVVKISYVCDFCHILHWTDDEEYGIDLILLCASALMIFFPLY